MNLEEKKLKIAETVLKNREELLRKSSSLGYYQDLGIKSEKNSNSPKKAEDTGHGLKLLPDGIKIWTLSQYDGKIPAGRDTFFPSSKASLLHLLNNPAVVSALLGAGLGGIAGLYTSRKKNKSISNKLLRFLTGATAGGLAGGLIGNPLHKFILDRNLNNLIGENEYIDNLLKKNSNYPFKKKAQLFDRSFYENLLRNPTVMSSLVGAGIGGLSGLVASPEHRFRNLLLGIGLGGFAGGGLQRAIQLMRTPVFANLPPEAQEAVKKAPKPFSDYMLSQADLARVGIPAAIIGAQPLSSFLSALYKIRRGLFSPDANAARTLSEDVESITNKGSNEALLKSLTTPSNRGVSVIKERYVVPSFKRLMAEKLRDLPLSKQLYNAARAVFFRGPTRDVINKARVGVPGDLRDLLIELTEGTRIPPPYPHHVVDEAVIRKAVPEYTRFLTEVPYKTRGIAGGLLAALAMLLNAYYHRTRANNSS